MMGITEEGVRRPRRAAPQGMGMMAVAGMVVLVAVGQVEEMMAQAGRMEKGRL